MNFLVAFIAGRMPQRLSYRRLSAVPLKALCGLPLADQPAAPALPVTRGAKPQVSVSAGGPTQKFCTVNVEVGVNLSRPRRFKSSGLVFKLAVRLRTVGLIHPLVDLRALLPALVRGLLLLALGVALTLRIALVLLASLIILLVLLVLIAWALTLLLIACHGSLLNACRQHHLLSHSKRPPLAVKSESGKPSCRPVLMSCQAPTRAFRTAPAPLQSATHPHPPLHATLPGELPRWPCSTA